MELLHSAQAAVLELVQVTQSFILTDSHVLKSGGLLNLPEATVVSNYSTVVPSLGLFFNLQTSNHIVMAYHALLRCAVMHRYEHWRVVGFQHSRVEGTLSLPPPPPLLSHRSSWQLVSD